VTVYRDGKETEPPLLKGDVRDIWKQIQLLAVDGTTLVLR